MGLRCLYWSGVLLIGVALAAVPSVAIVESYVGGSAIHGHIQNGRYFVNPGHGRPIVEVSESTWRTVYWLERLWPWSALLPAWIGIILTASGMGPKWKPPPAPPAEMPPGMLWPYLVGAQITVGGALLCWVITGTPWVTMLVGWILLCVCGGTCAWLYTRFLRQQPAAEPHDPLDFLDEDDDPGAQGPGRH
jgi:hypothetical protein